jgi:serpin B
MVLTKKPLRALGLRHAFEAADLSGMSADPLFISEALQKTFVEVNEEGTEAAAATLFAAESIGPRERPFEMIVDRPFVIVIHHSDRIIGGSILFMGVVFEPSAAH